MDNISCQEIKRELGSEDVLQGAGRGQQQRVTGRAHLRSPEVSHWNLRSPEGYQGQPRLRGKGTGKGRQAREGRHLRRAEKQYRTEVWWRALLTFVEQARA